MGANKLLLDDGGHPIIATSVDHALAAGLAEIVVVCGHQEDAIRDALAGKPVRVIPCPDYADGMARRIAAQRLAGVVARHRRRLRAAGRHAAHRRRSAAPHVHRLQSDRGPLHHRAELRRQARQSVLWDRRYFPEMMELAGDVGAKHLIGEHADQVTEIEADAGIMLDVDTPEAYRDLTGRSTP